METKAGKTRVAKTKRERKEEGEGIEEKRKEEEKTKKGEDDRSKKKQQRSRKFGTKKKKQQSQKKRLRNWFLQGFINESMSSERK